MRTVEKALFRIQGTLKTFSRSGDVIGACGHLFTFLNVEVKRMNRNKFEERKIIGMKTINKLLIYCLFFLNFEDNLYESNQIRLNAFVL